MKKAVVLGASGGMGYSVVNELVSRGIETVAFARNEKKLKQQFGEQELVTIKTGNAYEAEQIRRVTEEAGVIFHTISVPYPEWKEGHPQLMKNVLAAAKANKAKLVVIDNIYAYGKSNGNKVTEDTPKQPHTKKGKIRLQMEMLAKEAHQEGVATLIAHFPDFYGPYAHNTMLHFTLDAVVQNKAAQFVGNKKVKREYIFTPDGAKAVVELALHKSAYNQNWNIPGYGVISGDEIIQMIGDTTGYTKNVMSVGKGMISFLGLFNGNMREVVEMMYLTANPVVLDGGKYTREIGQIPKTAYEEGLKKTLEFMQKRLG